MAQPTFHYVEFRTSAHATEVEERVREALHTVAGEVEIEGVALEGHHKNPIVLMRAELKRAGDIARFWRKLAAESPEMVRTLENQIDARLDDSGTFYFRLHKQDAFLGDLTLTTGDDAIQVAAKVAAFPARREVAYARLKGFLEDLRGI